MTTKFTHNKRTHKIPTGYVIYRGPSMLDGKPIVVIALVGKSSNAKTGDMVQTYILNDNGQDPLQNVRELKDSSICGDCKHRRGTGGACYVNLGQGVLQVWKSYKNGNYPKANFADVGKAIRGRKVRLGTYGDPMAVPAIVWMYLTEYAAGHTGYTHQWNPSSELVKTLNILHPDQYDEIRALCMASVDSEDEWWLASYNNWRTFRVRSTDDGLNQKEFICPASDEAGKTKTCATCMACNGAGDNDSRLTKATPVIMVHGSLKSRFAASLAA